VHGPALAAEADDGGAALAFWKALLFFAGRVARTGSVGRFPL